MRPPKFVGIALKLSTSDGAAVILAISDARVCWLSRPSRFGPIWPFEPAARPRPPRRRPSSLRGLRLAAAPECRREQGRQQSGSKGDPERPG